MGKPFIDLTGQRFGKLVVLERDNTSKRTKWKCKCDCGNEVIVDAAHLKDGHTKSCGCLKTTLRHPKEWKRLFSIWRHMKSRCYDKNTRGYKWYGEKGVTICEEWLNSFEAFLTGL